MKPKNYKDFYDEVSEEAEVHKDVVNDFITFFYAKVRKNLSELTAPKIRLPGLGTFQIRKSKLEKSIKRHKDMIGNIQKRTYKGYGKYVPIKEKLKLMENALDEINKNLKKKKTFKNENK